VLLNLTDLSDEPLQSQIFRQIRARVLSGELEAGRMLPSIRSLAGEQKVSVVTVQRAYESLERESLIHSRRGKGFFVSEIARHDRKEMAFQGLVERLRPVFQAARGEGMSRSEILAAVQAILDQKEQGGDKRISDQSDG
jgi:GntR family transcriptional regulator